ncbi:hypothetical protein BN946_scf185008.g70 [Trametes cinnabarina]|uniref:Fork-head domain-containing protein n=1 Tax=Pycnoporus cinnabarinus TaxID=5643 RepID=A0A060SLM4_PYCCI|nr:hypothetical protein BN946_scf185008.g70 [Trametes cinnabarina]
MRAAPLDEEDCLPYTLPPGPYSELKPELSYAAIIGQAILASPGHALALQDIYEYITTVYPYYKRGEPTWMNSVRHALSTMAVFRKVQRDRSEGKSLWAIWDCDLPCFEGGGFKKTLCADMNSASSLRSSRKRGGDEVGGSRYKRKKTEDPLTADEDAVEATPVAAPIPILPPYFPPMLAPNPYHQPYYLAACAQQQLPADVLFPPLPPSSNYHRVISRAGSIAAKLQQPLKQLEIPTASQVADTTDEQEPPNTSPVERPPSSSSVPELVPSLSASSSPAPSSQLSLPDESSRDPSPVVAWATSQLDGPIEDPEAPWLHSDVPMPQEVMSTLSSARRDKGKAREQDTDNTVGRRLQTMSALPPPPSPTPERRAANTPRYGFRTPKKQSKISPPKPTRRSPRKLASSKKQPRPVTPPLMTASFDDIMRAMEQHATSGEKSRSSSPLSEVEVATMVMSACSDVEEASVPPSPDLPRFTPLPSTPPNRLAELEAEIFDFSPCKSPETRHVPRNCLSPALVDDIHNLVPPIHNPRAPYLRPDGLEDSFPSQACPAAPPRTPKKTPPRRPGSSGDARIDSPFRTPSRGLPNGFDDDFGSFFQSPGGSGLFDSFLPSLSKSPILYGLQSPGFGAQY